MTDTCTVFFVAANLNHRYHNNKNENPSIDIINTVACTQTPCHAPVHDVAPTAGAPRIVHTPPPLSSSWTLSRTLSQTLSPNPKSPIPIPYSSNFKPWIVPKSPNFTPQTPNPKPQKLQTPNSKPYTPRRVAAVNTLTHIRVCAGVYTQPKTLYLNTVNSKF